MLLLLNPWITFISISILIGIALIVSGINGVISGVAGIIEEIGNYREKKAEMKKKAKEDAEAIKSANQNPVDEAPEDVSQREETLTPDIAVVDKEVIPETVSPEEIGADPSENNGM